jgi:hypothetical protein
MKKRVLSAAGTAAIAKAAGKQWAKGFDIEASIVHEKQLANNPWRNLATARINLFETPATMPERRRQ